MNLHFVVASLPPSPCFTLPTDRRWHDISVSSNLVWRTAGASLLGVPISDTYLLDHYPAPTQYLEPSERIHQNLVRWPFLLLLFFFFSVFWL